jgi:hypothetical protein
VKRLPRKVAMKPGGFRSVVERAELAEGKMKIHYAHEAITDLFLLNPQSVKWSLPPREFEPEHTLTMGGWPRHTIEAEIEFSRPAKSRYRTMIA